MNKIMDQRTTNPTIAPYVMLNLFQHLSSQTLKLIQGDGFATNPTITTNPTSATIPTNHTSTPYVMLNWFQHLSSQTLKQVQGDGGATNPTITTNPTIATSPTIDTSAPYVMLNWFQHLSSQTLKQVKGDGGATNPTIATIPTIATNHTNHTSTNPSVPLLNYVFIGASWSGTPSLEKSEGVFAAATSRNVTNPTIATIPTNPTSTNPSVPLLYNKHIATFRSGTPSLEKSEGANSRLFAKNATIATNRSSTTNPTLGPFDYAQGDTFGAFGVLVAKRLFCKNARTREHREQAEHANMPNIANKANSNNFPDFCEIYAQMKQKVTQIKLVTISEISGKKRSRL